MTPLNNESEVSTQIDGSVLISFGINAKITSWTLSTFNWLSNTIFSTFVYNLADELVSEKEKYKDIGDDLDTAFVELILKE